MLKHAIRSKPAKKAEKNSKRSPEEQTHKYELFH